MSSPAAIYCRISLDSEGTELGVRRQEQDCRALAARTGLDVVEVYVDNDTGASTRSRSKRRPAYDRLLDDARGGRFGVVLAYSNSRLTRRPMELEGLITLHERHGIRIQTVVSGEDDLSTADGRMVARIKASVDAAEAERTAERVARAHLAHAQAGRPVGGTRPFGWDDDKVTLRPVEADAIRKAATDLLSGLPARRIADEWNAAGFVTTGQGKPWTGQAVRQVLLSPRLAGWRVHRPTGAAWSPVPTVAIGTDGQPVRGTWEPILTDAEHRAVVAALAKPEGRSRVPRRGARHYLLTGLLRCGRCNSVMYANSQKGAHYYTCRDNGHINSASGRAVDAIVTEVALRHLEAVELDAPQPAFAGQGRLDQIGEQVAELMAAFTAGTLSGAVVFPAVQALEAERDALAAQRTKAEAAAFGPDLTHLDRATWAELDTDRQRAALEALFAAVLIRPTTRRGNQFDAGRLEVVWSV